MTNKSKKYCAAFPCSNLAVYGAYCAEHKPAAALKETDPFYLSPVWRRFRAWYLTNHPLCEQCEREGRLIKADMVDHIIEIKDGGALTDESNAMSLCWKCHGIKTAKAKNHRKSRKDNRAGSRTETY
ncbi:MAG TPA: HNH endonuclease signature motif containing protein [Smithella sp.]|nr:HNH endonuclease signature motif containing protein [Smithella sp.]